MVKRLLVAAIFSVTVAACTTSPTAPTVAGDAAPRMENGSGLGSGD